MNIRNLINVICATLMCSMLGTDLFGMEKNDASDEARNAQAIAASLKDVGETNRSAGSTLGAGDTKSQNTESGTSEVGSLDEPEKPETTESEQVIVSDDKKEAEQQAPEIDITIAGQQYKLMLPYGWRTILPALSTLVEAQTRAGSKRDDIDDVFKKFFEDAFASLQQFNVFKNVLDLVSKENRVAISNQKRLPRVFVQSIADDISKILKTPEPIEQLLGIADRLGFAELKLACALCLIKEHPEFIETYTEEKSPGLFKDFVKREIRFEQNKATTQDLEFLAEHGYLPTWTSKIAGDDKDKATLVMRLIEENCTQPGFMVSGWIIFLSQEQVKKIVEKLDAKAKEFVGDISMKDSKDSITHQPEPVPAAAENAHTPQPRSHVRRRKFPAKEIKEVDEVLKKETETKFAPLPENYFKMAVRKAYVQFYRKHIDDVKTQPIFSNFGKDSSIAWGFVIRSLDIYQDFLLLWNNITPIQRLNLSFNALTTVNLHPALTALKSFYATNNKLITIAIPEELINLEEINLSNNQLTTITIPEELINLKTINLSNNQLTTVTIPATKKLVDSLTSLNLSKNPLSREQKVLLKARFPFAFGLD